MWTWILGGSVGLVILVGCLHWMAWVFAWGRWRQAPPSPPSARPAIWMVGAEFFIKLINDFRHLLALGVIATFALVAVLMLLPGLLARDVVAMEAGLKSVAATLGALVASVIGYYFGESAGKHGKEEPRVSATPVAVVQRPTKEPSGPNPVGPDPTKPGT